MAADDKEAAPNENAGAEAVVFASALLGGGYITDEEGAAPKDKLLTAITALAEVITSGVVATNSPKKKVSSGTDKAFSRVNPSVTNRNLNNEDIRQQRRETIPVVILKDYDPPVASTMLLLYI